MRDGGDLWRSAFLDGLRPDPIVSVTQWADQNRVLPQSTTNEAGLYSSSRTPYWREPMDCLSVNSPVERVIIKACSQSGKTDVLLNALGYVMDVAPGPLMYVTPTEDLAKLISQSRIDPMVAACPRLRGRVSEARSRDRSNQTLYKEFPGGSLRLVGTNSPVGLKSSPERYILGDEIDEWVGDVGGQGDPLDLAIVRTQTFRSNRKIMIVSSPTIEGRSRISTAYEDSDQRVYLVPCPHCGLLQEITWANHIRWDVHPKTGDPDPDTAHMRCEGCAARIPDWAKPTMLEQGAWVARKPERDPLVRGYWVPGTYSPFLSWNQAVDDFRKAKPKPTKLKVFVNTYLAETWKQLGDAPPWRPLYDRREKYQPGTVPAGGLILTMAVDVQNDRLEYEVVAWGRGMESWSVDYVVLPGKPTEKQVWTDLSREMGRVFLHENGSTMTVRALGIDTGGSATSTVYSWCRTQPMSRVFALKGTDDRDAVVKTSKSVEVQHQGKRLARGIRLWLVGASHVKNELYGWLRLEPPTEPGEPFPPGYCHFPEYGREHFEQLVAEQLVAHERKTGFTDFKWEKPAGVRNERLDCRVYNRAVAWILGLDRYSDSAWATLEANLGVAPAEPRERPASQPAPRRRDEQRRGDGGYLDRWRG
jgi:phage terminase large subunit GpA-like protein